MSRLLVSACLLGQKVRYDGRARTLLHSSLTRWNADGRVVPFCPELAGGLAVPRLPAEVTPGHDGNDVLAGHAKVVDSSGADVTDTFVTGAQLAVKLARSQGCTHALLTEASPSCGSTVLYSGHHDGVRRPGFGVTTAALRAAGIAVYPPEQIDRLAQDCAW